MSLLKDKIERLEAESDCKISSTRRDDIWRKIRLGIPLSDQDRLIHDYDLECFRLTGKWN
jgi:hypothetical protein